MVKRWVAAGGLSALVLAAALPQAQGPAPAGSRLLQFVFVSDVHYGITRSTFRGAKDVDAHVVNAALVARMNALGSTSFPTDGGLEAGKLVGAVDFVAEGGDIANREEVTEAGRIQSATTSWAQFRQDYLEGVTLRDRGGRQAPVYMVPGNHDASNAVGFPKPMEPAIDKAAMVGIYNLMMRPEVPKTATTYDYAKDRVLTSRDIGGVHFVFANIWLDSVSRAWMEQDLAKVPATTPVFVITHDQPDAESKHFTNPNGRHDINAKDLFENLLSDTLADGVTTDTPDTIEQAALERFLAAHPNVTAYFHGNSNWNQFYDWTGPGHSVALHTFRADSPMKGHFSGPDETKLSFQIATVDMTSRTMTVREVLWNADPTHPDAPLVWGASTTVALVPRLGQELRSSR